MRRRVSRWLRADEGVVGDRRRDVEDADLVLDPGAPDPGAALGVARARPAQAVGGAEVGAARGDGVDDGVVAADEGLAGGELAQVEAARRQVHPRHQVAGGALRIDPGGGAVLQLLERGGGAGATEQRAVVRRRAAALGDGEDSDGPLLEEVDGDERRHPGEGELAAGEGGAELAVATRSPGDDRLTESATELLGERGDPLRTARLERPHEAEAVGLAGPVHPLSVAHLRADSRAIRTSRGLAPTSRIMGVGCAARVDDASCARHT